MSLLADVLRHHCPDGAYVRAQLPLILDDFSEPAPDAAIVPGTPRDHVHEHPRTVLLIAEVSDSTLGTDLGNKASAYARAGFAEYWVIDLVRRRLVVHRAPHGDTRAEIVSLADTEVVRPLFAPQSTIAVADLMP